MLVLLRIRAVVCRKTHTCRGFDDRLRQCVQMKLAIDAISRSQLLAGDGKLAIFTITDEDGGAARSDKYFAVFEFVDFRLFGMVEDHRGATLQIVHFERIPRDERRVPAQVVLVCLIAKLQQAFEMLLPLLFVRERLSIGRRERHVAFDRLM